MTALTALPKTRIVAHVSTAEDGKLLQVRLQNSSKALAFQVAVAARDSHGEDIAPVMWSDNYVELMPGETQVLTARLPSHLPDNATVVVSGWNIPEQALHLSTSKATADAGSEAE
jgi:exo-1,4-beta-D-glucosaminidase